jgi:hypothetical protein
MKKFRFEKYGASLLIATLLVACGGGGGGGGDPLSGTELKLDSPTLVTEVDGVLRPFVIPVGAPSPDPVARDTSNPDPVVRDAPNPASVTADESTLAQQLTNSATNTLKQLGVDSLITVSVKTETSEEVENEVMAGIVMNPNNNINNRNRSCTIEHKLKYDSSFPPRAIQNVKDQINATGGDLSKLVTPENVRQYFHSWLYVPGSVVYDERSRTATARFVSRGMSCEEWNSTHLYGYVPLWRIITGFAVGGITAVTIRLGLPAVVAVFQPEFEPLAVSVSGCLAPGVGSLVAGLIMQIDHRILAGGAATWCVANLSVTYIPKIIAFLRPAAVAAAADLPGAAVAAGAAGVIEQSVQMTEAAFSGVSGVSSIGGFGSGNPFFQPSVGGMLVAGKFRSQDDVNRMNSNDQRNTLIVEMYNRTKNGVSYYQSLNNDALAGQAALLVALRADRGRTDEQLKAMSTDDMRNTVIVAVNYRTGPFYGSSRSISELQKLSNISLAKMLLWSNQP